MWLPTLRTAIMTSCGSQWPAGRRHCVGVVNSRIKLKSLFVKKRSDRDDGWETGGTLHGIVRVRAVRYGRKWISQCIFSISRYTIYLDILISSRTPWNHTFTLYCFHYNPNRPYHSWLTSQVVSIKKIDIFMLVINHNWVEIRHFLFKQSTNCKNNLQNYKKGAI